ncbi:hypothetical protein [Vulcanisaeta thermophila]|uniref:hypothetical protein n=1 Tax=Vulcanisaeta thermophila TaxID=867917 RepID=UPI000853C27D|nr:hypothetical protein [Vulcanisaeta thermophila]
MSNNALLPSVRAVIQRDLRPTDLGLATQGLIKAGTVVSLPPQVLEALLRRGLASLYDEDIVSDKDIVKMFWLENRSPEELRELPKDFYIRARLSSIKNPDSKITTQLKELARLRLRKILTTIAQNPGYAESREFMSKLTIEEEMLVRLIAPWIKEFMNSVIGL